MIADRYSARAFLPDPIDRAELAAIFADAQRAPSWCNVQPWRVCVTEGAKTRAVAEALVAAAKRGSPHAEIPFPVEYPAPYKERRQACGVALYTNMGIGRHDMEGRYHAWLRNYALFDAPHVAIVACDRRLGPYAYLDVGVWLGYVLAACAERHIDTCPMASVAAYPEPLRAQLPIADTDVVLFGLALGHADPNAAANRTRTVREPIEANVVFCS